MKTLTTLTAVAALIAGLSIASAQSPMSQSQGKSDSMGKNGSTQATGNGKFCIETSAGGSWDCKYASLAACEKDAKPQNRQCNPNPKTGTTGSR